MEVKKLLTEDAVPRFNLRFSNNSDMDSHKIFFIPEVKSDPTLNFNERVCQENVTPIILENFFHIKLETVSDVKLENE